MDVCGPAVVPRSWFLGGPFVWSDEDRAAQLAWTRRQYQLCPSGHGRDGWLDENGRPAEEPPFLVRFERCHACRSATLAEHYERKQFKNWKGEHDAELETEKMAGVYPVLMPNDKYRPRPGE